MLGVANSTLTYSTFRANCNLYKVDLTNSLQCRVSNRKNVAKLRFFISDGSGILSQLMAMRTMAGGGRLDDGAPPDILVRMPAARQIQADSRISSYFKQTLIPSCKPLFFSLQYPIFHTTF